MAFGLGPDGFKRARYNDLVTQMRESARDLFGENVRVEPPSFIGIVIAITSWFLAQLWVVLELIYNNSYADTAEGINLDKKAKDIGVSRRPAERAKGTAIFSGDNGIVVPEGFLVETEDGVRFETTESVEIEAGEAAINIRAIVAGERGNVPAETITEIVNPQEGISSVTNNEATENGRDRESDTDFRERYFLSLATGGASTLDAIRAELLDIEGVIDAIVEHNDTNEAVEGRPAKSIEAFVYGGVDVEVAKAIMQTKAGGIQAFGDSQEIIEDEGGNTHTIGYTRPDIIGVFVDVEVQTDEDYPIDGNEQVRNKIIEYIGGTGEDATQYDGLGLGEDVIYVRLYKVIQQIDGIIDIPTLKIDTADPPQGEDNISIEVREVAETDWQKVSVADV